MNDKYIAMTGLSQTENLGSQMWHFASLYTISRRSGHRILFFREYANLGKGLRLHRHFPDLPFSLISIDDLDEAERTHVVHRLNSDVAVDSQVFQLDSGLNYNFTGLFISYKYWYPRRKEVAQMYHFDADTAVQAAATVACAQNGGRQVVAVHVRRDDYINGAFINVTREYYDAAFANFDEAEVNYLVFSDDLPWCRDAFSDKANVYYSNAPSPIVDMCAMSLCDHNIIANSSFSFWGAFLNRNPSKRVFCPAKTLKSDIAIPHLNYAWYPDEFIGLDAGNI
jgi:hypothetical protein